MANSSDKKKKEKQEQPKVTMLQKKLVDMSTISDLLYTFEAIEREVQKMIDENGEEHKVGFLATALRDMTSAWYVALKSAIKESNVSKS